MSDLDRVDISEGVREGMCEAHELTLRDQFAIAALQGMGLNYEKVGQGFSEAYAKGAYELANAMMDARK